MKTVRQFLIALICSFLFVMGLANVAQAFDVLSSSSQTERTIAMDPGRPCVILE
jgi:hypothetical protein